MAKYSKKKTFKKHKRYQRNKFASKQSSYRSIIPRTIQIATKRNQNQTLRFTINQTWVVDPTLLAAGKSAVLSFRANSIFHSHMPTGGATNTVFKSQNPQKYNNNGSANPLIQQNADGWDQWTNRYQHFCVVGAKMTYSYEPIDTGVPAIAFSHISGVSGAVTTDTTSAEINELPFLKRHSLSSSPLYSIATGGIRGNMKYSVRQFEGVKDPEDNSNLRGRFENPNLNPPSTGSPPSEQSFFYFGVAPIDPATQNKMPKGVLRIKLEYITQLKEPTETNFLQVITNTADAPDEL